MYICVCIYIYIYIQEVELGDMPATTIGAGPSEGVNPS